MQVIDSEGYLKVKLIGGPAGPFVPYTGATTNVDLGTHSLTARNIIVNHPSGSGVAVSITKGGAGEALTVVKTSGSGNAMSVTGGITQLDELHLTTDLADAYIASATTWNNKVPQTRTLTINGTTQDLSADRTFTISTGITIGTTAITSGTVGRVLFEGTGNVVQESANLFWDNTNGRLGIGTSSPQGNIDINATYATTGYPLIVKNTGYFNAFFQGTSANNQAAFYLENNRGSTNSYGGFAIGGSTSTLGNIFGLTRPDRLFMFADGVNNVGYAIGTLQNTPLQFGTNNVIRATVFGTGNIGINTATDAGFKLDVNGTARVSGTGTTSATTAFTIQNSAGTPLFLVKDDKQALLYGLTYFYDLLSASSGLFGVQQTGFTAIGGASYNAMLTVKGSGATSATSAFQLLNSSNTELVRVWNDGAVGIGVGGTNAGFKLDVNGTARVSGTGNNSLLLNGDGLSVNAQNHKVVLNATTNGITRMYLTSTFAGANFNTGIALVSGTTSKWSLASYGATSDFTFYNDALAGDALFIKGTTNNVILGSTTDVASALLNVTSTTKGFLPPRMTTTQKNAIASPAAGLMVYDTTLNVISFYNGTIWL
jgi:hypothetical protein